MAALILPSRRVVQPQGPVEVDWDSRAARGLVFATIDPLSPISASGHLQSPSGTSFVRGISSNGRGVSAGDTQSTNNTVVLPGSVRDAIIGKPFTLELLIDGTFASANAQAAYCHRSSTTQSFYLGVSASQVQFAADGFTDVFLNFGGATQPFALTFVADGANVSVYRDGQLADSAASTLLPPSTTIPPSILNRSSGGSRALISKVSKLALYSRALSADEATSNQLAPWRLFRPIQRRIIIVPSAGGAVDLVPAEASHAHSADNVVLTSSANVAVDSATHAHTADSLTLGTTASVNLAVADASHAHTADSPVLVVASVLAVADAQHAQVADSVVLAAVETLAVASADHTHGAENISLTVGGIGLTVSDATHAQAAEAPTLSADSFLITADGSHGQAADLVTLSTSVFFSVDSAAHAQTADNIFLDGAPTLAVNAAQHAQAADGIALGMDSWLAVASAAHAQTADQPTLTVTGDDVPETYPLAGQSQSFPLAGQAQTYPLQG